MKRNFKILGVNHVAVATREIKVLQHVLVDILGMQSSQREHIQDELVDVVKIFPNDKKTAVELLEPSSNKSTIGKYLNNKGAGIHHIALTVDSIENAIFYLKNNNIKLIYETPKIGADNNLIIFIHPKSSPGLLIELCQQT